MSPLRPGFLIKAKRHNHYYCLLPTAYCLTSNYNDCSDFNKDGGRLFLLTLIIGTDRQIGMSGVSVFYLGAIIKALFFVR